MRKEQSSFLQKQRALLACLTLAAVAAVGLPVSASANTTAKATIMNKVSVNYRDAAGGGGPLGLGFNADATTIVTVNLVKAALSITNAPSGNNAPPALNCTNFGTNYPSGSTLSVLYALTATANGQDTYNLAMANTPTNVTATVAYNILTYNGAVAGALPSANPNPATRTLGSAIPTRVVSDTVLEFPGGALEGFAVNDLVVVQTTAGPRTYLVTAFSVGTAPTNTNAGSVPHTDVGTAVAEGKGTLTLGAWTGINVTINGVSVPVGGTPAPTFTVPATQATLNVPVGEMVLVKVDVTANTTTAGTNGTVDFTLTTNDSANTPANTQTAGCKLGTWVAPNLNITKSVRNFSVAPAGPFTATATGNPQQILEYQVVVSNTSGQASLVNVSDTVPAYTSLMTHTTYGNGVAGTLFAKVTDNAANTVSLTTAVDSETQPLAAASVETAFGDAATGTAPALNLRFFLGDNATNAAGGKLPYCSDGSAISADGLTCTTGTRITTLTILYQVRID